MVGSLGKQRQRRAVCAGSKRQRRTHSTWYNRPSGLKMVVRCGTEGAAE